MKLSDLGKKRVSSEEEILSPPQSELDTAKRVKRRASSIVIETKEGVVAREVPIQRREEIRRYLELFGYKAEHTILQVHFAGYFGRGKPSPREASNRERAERVYGGNTFVVVGRTHDPAIAGNVIKPRKKTDESSPGYVGYLFKDKDRYEKPPHELLPLDFTPTGFHYPAEWKDMFATRGFLIAMHVPSDYARKKSELTKKLRQAGKTASVKEDWRFIDDVESAGYPATTARDRESAAPKSTPCYFSGKNKRLGGGGEEEHS